MTALQFNIQLSDLATFCPIHCKGGFEILYKTSEAEIKTADFAKIKASGFNAKVGKNRIFVKMNIVKIENIRIIEVSK